MGIVFRRDVENRKDGFDGRGESLGGIAMAEKDGATCVREVADLEPQLGNREAGFQGRSRSTIGFTFVLEGSLSLGTFRLGGGRSSGN